MTIEIIKEHTGRNRKEYEILNNLMTEYLKKSEDYKKNGENEKSNNYAYKSIAINDAICALNNEWSIYNKAYIQYVEDNGLLNPDKMSEKSDIEITKMILKKDGSVENYQGTTIDLYSNDEKIGMIKNCHYGSAAAWIFEEE